MGFFDSMQSSLEKGRASNEHLKNVGRYQSAADVNAETYSKFDRKGDSELLKLRKNSSTSSSDIQFIESVLMNRGYSRTDKDDFRKL